MEIGDNSKANANLLFVGREQGGNQTRHLSSRPLQSALGQSGKSETLKIEEKNDSNCYEVQNGKVECHKL